MNKRLVIVVASFAILSVVLLGFSFAKESGKEAETYGIQTNTDNIRIVYSNNVINKDNKSVDLSLINKSNDIKDYVITIEGIDSNVIGNIKYKLDDGEEKVLSKNIFNGTLSPFGNDGDYVAHHIEFIFDGEIEFKLISKEYNGEVVYGS